MLIPLIPIALIVLGGLAYGAHYSFRQRDVSRGWYIAFYVAVWVGITAGIYFGFFFRYLLAPDFEVHSFPVPAAFLVLEKYENGGSHWVDFVTPAPLLFAASNIPVFACLAVLPIWIVNTMWRICSRAKKSSV